MGVCNLEYFEETNTLMVHLRRPGLLIGKAGTSINKLSKNIGCKIDITEVIL
jgi:ribosomal protein S3